VADIAHVREWTKAALAALHSAPVHIKHLHQITPPVFIVIKRPLANLWEIDRFPNIYNNYLCGLDLSKNDLGKINAPTRGILLSQLI